MWVVKTLCNSLSRCTQLLSQDVYDIIRQALVSIRKGKFHCILSLLVPHFDFITYHIFKQLRDNSAITFGNCPMQRCGSKIVADIRVDWREVHDDFDSVDLVEITCLMQGRVSWFVLDVWVYEILIEFRPAKQVLNHSCSAAVVGTQKHEQGPPCSILYIQ